jgi:hypothetical protein
LSALKGGFYFHPSDEDLSPGTPVEKKATWVRGFGLQQLRKCYSHKNKNVARVGQPFPYTIHEDI